MATSWCLITGFAAVGFTHDYFCNKKKKKAADHMAGLE